MRSSRGEPCLQLLIDMLTVPGGIAGPAHDDPRTMMVETQQGGQPENRWMAREPATERTYGLVLWIILARRDRKENVTNLLLGVRQPILHWSGRVICASETQYWVARDVAGSAVAFAPNDPVRSCRPPFCLA